MTISTKDKYRLCRQRQALFSRTILDKPLHAYQCRVAQYVLDVVRENRDEVVIIEMPRQSGKNEMSAHLELNILAQNRKTGGEIVKAAPTFRPQVVTSKARFTKLAAQAAEHYPWMAVTPQEGYMFRNGRAGISFFSADKKSNVVGATASLMLEIDECQDVDPDKYFRDFAPMRASTGAPVIAFGTTWTDNTLLEQFKRSIEEGKVKGKAFRILPDEVGRENSNYISFVEGQVALLGRSHPAVASQYFLEPLINRGRMLSKQQLRQIMGSHEARTERRSENIVVAGVDFAGADEDAGQLASTAKVSARDSVAVTIASVQWTPIVAGVLEAEVKILARYEYTNVHPLSIQSTLARLLNDVWKVNRCHMDATGIGATGSMMLAKAIDNGSQTRAFPVVFDAGWNLQTRLVNQYLSLINGSRLQDYRNNFDCIDIAMHDVPDATDPDRHIWWQRAHARLEARASKRMHAEIPASEGHDDLIVSEMLCCDAAFALGAVSEIKQTKRASIGG